MNKRKKIFNKIIGKGRKDITEPPNIKKTDKEEDNLENSLDKKVPEGFKKKMEQLSKEELIADLFFTKYELAQVKRQLELTTFKLTQENDKDIDI